MPTRKFGTCCLFILLFSLLGYSQEKEPAPKSSTRLKTEGLREHVETLSSKDFAGRYGPLAEKTRQYIEGAFRKLGLETFAEDYRFPFKANGLEGVNLAGILRSTAKDRQEGYIMLHAHYDHLGHRGERWYPGACDNASGVAVILEALAHLDRSKMKRDLVVVAFDLEERGLLGSFAWVERPPLPLKDCAMTIALDMLGRPALGIVDDLLFVQGWEWTPEILSTLKELDEKSPTALGYFWTDLTGDRADFVAFKRKSIPHLFFSCGENEDYHQISDSPERLDFELLAREGDIILALVEYLLAAEALPQYRKEAEKNLIEFQSLSQLARAMSVSKSPRMTMKLRQQATLLIGFAESVIDRAEVTDQDRQQLLEVSGLIQKAMR